jgi:hypothetical protein
MPDPNWSICSNLEMLTQFHGFLFNPNLTDDNGKNLVFYVISEEHCFKMRPSVRIFGMFMFMPCDIAYIKICIRIFNNVHYF